uniref:RNA-directed RNA polymerase n=1 Tax=Leviviridae sp. TaxID=2027243 RepID=A0A514DAB4_9VIRU|nr:MAG: RNA-dependent RNA polymerase [Leviviridae sp.]
MKSNVSDLLKLVECVYIDASAKCIADVSDLRDLETIRSRVVEEGISFLTITLPNFCRDFERSLQNGYIDSKDFLGFKKSRSIPAFLQGMISHLFDRETGRIYDETNPYNGAAESDISTIVEAIRQICLLFKKVEIDCTSERTQSALDAFVELELSFQQFKPEPEITEAFTSVSRVLWTPIIGSIELSELDPQHGPGSTAEGISGNQKYLWRRWHDRLEPYFPLLGSAYPLGTDLDSKELEFVSIISTEEEQPVKVTPVPKTLKSPRIIAIEPVCMQYAQQGIRNLLYEKIENHWLTSGHVNFRDQGVNQSLAISASSTGRLATIDLSDASDRVPRELALEMFSMHPDLQAAIDACRSNSAELPDGRLVSPLGKFASMGSALCFPVEAMYFYTICIVALLRAQNLPVTLRNIFNVSRGVHVYGDDIIVPTTYATIVLDYLHKYNCKVNPNKTFLSGSFRESCGVDAFKGIPVTPVYIRRMRPKDKRQAKEIISWVATSNLFYKKGYWRTTAYMRKCIDALVGPLPYVSEHSPALGYTSFLGYQSVERWNSNLQRFEIKALVPSPVYRTDELDGYSALSKSLKALKRSIRDSSGLDSSSTTNYLSPAMPKSALPESRDVHHLEHFALHGAVVLKRRWVPSLT